MIEVDLCNIPITGLFIVTGLAPNLNYTAAGNNKFSAIPVINAEVGAQIDLRENDVKSVSDGVEAKS